MIIFFKEQIRQKFSALLMEILRYMQVSYDLGIFFKIVKLFLSPARSIYEENQSLQT